MNYGNISIKRCSNGYLVEIPEVTSQKNWMEQNSADIAAQVAHMVRELYKDPLLQSDDDNALSDLTISDPFPKVTTLYVFKEFPEVLEFLTEKFSQ